MKLGVVGGRHAKSLSNQPAQAPAAACARYAGLRGPLAPACMRLPVLKKNLAEPTQRMALDTLTGPPPEVGGPPRARGLFLCIFHGPDAPRGFVSADVSTCPAAPDHPRGTAPDAAASFLRNEGGYSLELTAL